MLRPKVIAVVGPTASGKTSLGIFLAQKIGGEVVSADSRQVYKDLDIGTGKVTKKEMAGIPHHLLDVTSPLGRRTSTGEAKKNFTADDFVKLGSKAIKQIIAQKRVPIIVGGTGFYIDALLGRITLANVEPNPVLRKKLVKKSAAQLFLILKKLDPERAKSIDPKNVHRLIRAIEVARAKSGARSVAEPVDVRDLAPGYTTLWLGINPKKETLKRNIHARLLARMKIGMVAEAKQLHARGLSYRRMETLGLEYRSLANYLQGNTTKEEMLVELERAIQKYAKRQMQWFKRNKDIRWVKNKSEALRLTKEFLKSSGR